MDIFGNSRTGWYFWDKCCSIKYYFTFGAVVLGTTSSDPKIGRWSKKKQRKEDFNGNMSDITPYHTGTGNDDHSCSIYCILVSCGWAYSFQNLGISILTIYFFYCWAQVQNFGNRITNPFFDPFWVWLLIPLKWLK